MCVLFRMNGKFNIVLGLAMLLMSYIGCLFPLLGFYLTRMIVLLSSLKYSPESERPQHIQEAQVLSLTLLSLCVAAYFIAAIREILFNIVGNRLTAIVKKTLFKKLMRMSVTFYDKFGSCSAYLNDCENASKMGCRIFWGISENTATIICGLTISFYSCWQITLIAFSVIPVLLIAGKVQNQFTNGYSIQTDEANKRCHQKVVDALINFKTVVSFNLQKRFENYYEELLAEPRKVAIKRGNIVGLTFGFAQALISCIFAMIFYIGALLIRDKGLKVLDIYTSIYAIMFSMMTAGTQLHFIN
jgi:ATP-binding cassette subfamily B (MDR/TAP) protein 1